MTRTDRLISGTPLYIAPERIRQPSLLDPRSDLYSVGNVAFYLLSGEDLYNGETPLDVLYQVVNEKPRRPSEVSKQAIPAKLDDLVIDCLTKEPDDRPANVSVVMEILDALKRELPWRQDDARQAWQSCYS